MLEVALHRVYAKQLLSTQLHLRWPNTVFARAFADVIQRVHKDCKNKHVVNRAIILFIQNPHYLRYFSLLLKAVYWWLYYVIKKDMLGKVTTQRIQKFLAFLCYRKNPVKCSACAVARKIETECFCRNLPISNDPVVRISRNLAKKIVQKSREWSITKKPKFDIGKFQ